MHSHILGVVDMQEQTKSWSQLLHSDHSSSKHNVLQTYSTKLPDIVTICSDLMEWKFDELQSSHSDQLYSHSPLQREERKWESMHWPSQLKTWNERNTSASCILPCRDLYSTYMYMVTKQFKSRVMSGSNLWINRLHLRYCDTDTHSR